MARILISLATLNLSLAAYAHHSVGAFYDSSTVSRISGTIGSVQWVNPHVRFTVDVTGANGESERWRVEAGALNSLDRQGVPRDLLRVGEDITVIGYTSRRGRPEMVAASVDLANGENVVLWSGLFGGPEESNPAPDAAEQIAAAAAEAARSAQGMFRVWTIGLEYTHDATDAGDETEMPLTASARAARANFDPLVDDPGLSCTAPGMPALMDNPFPMAMAEDDGDILIQMEQWDVVRRIHIDDDADPAAQPATPYGYSTGRWEDDNTLVVTTTRINWPYFDDIGTPQSEQLELVERYTLSDDETRLDYLLTVTDPEMLTESVTFDGYWTWIPGEQIKRYDCAVPDL
ncbi:MAG: hypothetical protein GWN29_14030 [Gammaproteobacteria bacterium]|nr:hypothetical protein [Gammaproteobacteria bacterium]